MVRTTVGEPPTGRWWNILSNGKVIPKKMPNNCNSSNSSIPRQLAAGFFIVNMVFEAQIQAEEHIEFTLRETQFFDRFATPLNERQMRVLRRMLDEGPKGFEGGMNAKKYCSIMHTSKATATRDLQDLVERKNSSWITKVRATPCRI